MGALRSQREPASGESRSSGFLRQAVAIRSPVTTHSERSHGTPLLLSHRERPGSDGLLQHAGWQHSRQQCEYDVRDFLSANTLTPGTSRRLARHLCHHHAGDARSGCCRRSAVVRGPWLLRPALGQVGKRFPPLLRRQLVPGRGREGMNALEAPCLNCCLWIYSSSVIIYKIIIG